MPINNLIKKLPMSGRANFLPYQIGPDGKASWALPGILAGAANAVTAPYRAMNPENVTSESYDQAQAFNPEEEAANFALNMLGGGGVVGRAPKNALGMNVWHGSPHKFEPTPLNNLGEFNAANIGSGEGAQAYGHGHYTAESRGVARGYKDKLQGGILGEKTSSFLESRMLKSNLDLLITATQSQVLDTISAYAGEGPAKMSLALNRLADSFESQGFDWQLVAAPNVRKLAKDKQLLSDVSDNIAGSLYKVDIPDEHIAKMLDWDKPLSEQAEAVKRMLEKAAPSVKTVDTMSREELINTLQYIDRNGSFTDEAMINEFGRPATLDELRESARSMDVDKYLADNMVSDKHATGESAYKQLVAKFGGGENAPTIAGQAKASELLKNAGIPGIRYLDADSRVFKDNTSNFVVFPGNEHMMTILERNGQAMSPESQAIARYREIKGDKSVVRMEAALRTAGVPLPKNEPVAYIQSLVDRAHRRN